MLSRRFTLLALLPLFAGGACRDSTAPDQPAEPAIRIESPVSGAIIADTLVQLRGIAEAPGGIDWIEVTYDSVNQTGNTSTLYRSDDHYKPDGTVDLATRFSFDTPLRMYAGAKQVTIQMWYRLSRDEPASSQGHSISVTVPFRIWKKPAFRLCGGLTDTLYARALSVVAGSTGGLDALPRVEMVVDPGTPGERHVDANSGFPYSTHCAETDYTSWMFDLTDPLANGPHRVLLRLSDEMGAVDSITRNFVTHVTPLTYGISALPGLGGTDSDALGVNVTGDVAGWALDAGGAARAVLWQDGVLTALPTSSTSLSGRAYSLNDAGDIVGMVEDAFGTGHCPRAIRWTTSTWQFVDTGLTPCDKVAMRVNSSGATLVVQSNASYGDTTAWLVRDTVVAYFTNFDPAQWAFSPGLLSLNDRGEIAGARRNDYGTPSPFSSGPTIATPTFRPPLNLGHPAGALVGLNNASQAVGFYSGTTYFSPQPGSALIDLDPYLLPRTTPVALTDDGSVLAFDATEHVAYIWRGGKTYRVAVDGDWELDRVSAMNDAGIIVGHATQRSTGRTTAVILRP